MIYFFKSEKYQRDNLNLKNVSQSTGFTLINSQAWNFKMFFASKLSISCPYVLQLSKQFLQRSLITSAQLQLKEAGKPPLKVNIVIVWQFVSIIFYKSSTRTFKLHCTNTNHAKIIPILRFVVLVSDKALIKTDTTHNSNNIVRCGAIHEKC